MSDNAGTDKLNHLAVETFANGAGSGTYHHNFCGFDEGVDWGPFFQAKRSSSITRYDRGDFLATYVHRYLHE